MLFDHLDVANGDCKAVGLPWTSEEAYAVRNLGIPAELVRQGILTKEDEDSFHQNGIKPTTKKVETKVVPQAEVEPEAPATPDEEVVAEDAELAQSEHQTGSTEEVEQTLEEVQTAYKEIVGNIPPRYRNDKDWLMNKILSTK